MQITADQVLTKHLRQYRHNDGSDGFVFAYELEGTQQEITKLLADNAALRDSLRQTLSEALGWLDDARGLDDEERTTGKGIPWAERAYALLEAACADTTGDTPEA